MELRIEPFSFPEAIHFNFDELKKELVEKVEFYKALVYTENDVKAAKIDVANLRKLVKAMSDERIRIKKQCLQPYDAFEDKVKQLTEIVNEPINLINEQIKIYEDQQKQEKKRKIEKHFDSIVHPEWLTLSMIWNEKWLNANVSMKSVLAEFDIKFESIKKDLATLSELPEFVFESIETYKTTLDLNKSIAEGRRLSEIQKRKEEQEKARAEQERLCKGQEEHTRQIMPQATREPFVGTTEIPAIVTEEEIAQSVEDYREAANVGGVHMPEELSKQWISFRAFLSVKDAKELKEFFESRKIEFGRI